MTAVLNPKGRIYTISPQAIRPGDMVDVSVSVEVVRRRRGPQGDFIIEAILVFCPLHVVKLKSAQ